MTLQLGEIVAEKYRIVRLLGKGGMGEVYEGENLRIRRKVAIKTLLASVSSKPDVIQRFEREAQAAGRIGSEHIVEVLDLGDLADGSRFMVMEFLEGSTLSDRIVSRGRIPPRESARIVAELLDGLGAAHQAGIIHRDLKPANVFLLANKQGRADFVKILDFGVSKFSVLSDEMSMTSTGAVVGTPYYMSPEQAKGAKFIDARSDLYSVGVILYESITGQVPFNAQTFNELIFKIALEQPPPPESFVPDLDPRVAAIMRKAMARESAERYQTAKEFKDALDAWANEVDRGVPANGSAMLGWPGASGQPQGQAPQGWQQQGAQPRLGGTQIMPMQMAPGQTQPRPAATVIAMPPAPPPVPGAPQIAALQVTPTPARKSSMLPVFLLLGLVVVGGGATAAAFLLRGRNADASDANNATTSTAEKTTPAPKSPAPTTEKSASETSAAVDPTSTTNATPTTSSSAVVLDASAATPPPASHLPEPPHTAVAQRPPPPPPPTGVKPPPPSTGTKPPPPPPGGRSISGSL